MTVKNSPEFACGQVLYSVKMSRLNYFLQETPFSVYITLRKKFQKDFSNQAEIEKSNNGLEKTFNDKIECARKENLELREKLNNSLRDKRMLRYDIQE